MARKKSDDNVEDDGGIGKRERDKKVDNIQSISLTPEAFETIFGRDRHSVSISKKYDDIFKDAILKIDTQENLNVYSMNQIVSGGINTYIDTKTHEQQLEEQIKNLDKERLDLIKRLGDTTKTTEEKSVEIEELKKNNDELQRLQRIEYLRSRVHWTAANKLLKCQSFRDLFENQETCMAVVMSVDIRRSTELMLKARDPKLFADFITGLCNDLTNIILRNYGVFDKFTGDGILAFFPDFYSGEDAPYFAIKAAHECHRCFFEHYDRARSCFTSILVDVGLCIGIDFGNVHLVKMQDGLTVIGNPVVYACRMSSATAGHTLLNQPAYEVASQNFGEWVNFQEEYIEIKHEGRMLAYLTTLSDDTRELVLPKWVQSDTVND